MWKSVTFGRNTGAAKGSLRSITSTKSKNILLQKHRVIQRLSVTALREQVIEDLNFEVAPLWPLKLLSTGSNNFSVINCVYMCLLCVCVCVCVLCVRVFQAHLIPFIFVYSTFEYICFLITIGYKDLILISKDVFSFSKLVV